MKRRFLLRTIFLALVAFVLTLGVYAQEHAQPPAQAQRAEDSSQQQPANPDTAADTDLRAESEKAVHAEEGHEENAEFKYSAMVARLGRMIGLDAHGMYWVSLAINFLIMAGILWMLLKSKVPQMFRERTQAIQKALKEAQTASAEATRRLGEIEARLAKLDSEVSAIKTGAERDVAAEEDRIRAAAEDDKRKVVDSAEAEIAAIARSARQELKNFAASLAVDIATRKIKVDDNTDQALVREFAGHLEKDGH